MKVLLINDDTLKNLKNFNSDENDISILRFGLEYRGHALDIIDTVPSNIVDYVKKHNIDIIITNNESIATDVFSSLSIGTSTYVISNNLSIDNKNAYRTFYSEGVLSIVDDISDSRKPSEEQRWNRHYTDEQLKKPFPEMTKNDYIRSKQINSNLISLEYFDNKITYGQRENFITDYAGKLEYLGVKPGDSVALCMPNTPESVLLGHSISEKRAVTNNIFPLSNSKEMLHCLKLMKSKIAFIYDVQYKELRKIIDKTYLDKVYLLTPFESLPYLNIPYNMLQKVKGFRPKDSGYGTFSDFLNLPSKEFVAPMYEKNWLSGVQYTSGTSGSPKAVAETDDMFNARAHQYDQVNVGLGPELRFAQCLPICGKAYGEFTMHLGLSNGACNVLLPKFSSHDLPKLIKDNNIEGITLPPIAWLHVIDMPEFKKLDLSNFKLATIGGDGAIEKHIRMIQEGLEKQGFKGQAILGSGGTELGVTFSTNTLDSNVMGTSGPLMIGNNCIIRNSNGEECGYGEMGTVYYDTVNPSPGYLDDSKLDKTTDGINLGDCGFIDDNGNLTVAGRISDMIDVDDKLMSPMNLEKLINECTYVKYGYVVRAKASDRIRICYTTYEDYSGIDVDNEVLNKVPLDLRNITEVFRVTMIPETAGLKVDRARLAGNIDDILYSENSKRKIIKRRH